MKALHKQRITESQPTDRHNKEITAGDTVLVASTWQSCISLQSYDCCACLIDLFETCKRNVMLAGRLRKLVAQHDTSSLDRSRDGAGATQVAAYVGLAGCPCHAHMMKSSVTGGSPKWLPCLAGSLGAVNREPMLSLAAAAVVWEFWGPEGPACCSSPVVSMMSPITITISKS